MKLDPRNVTLEWVCNNDDEHEGADDQVIVHEPLMRVEDGGEVKCPQCGQDMELAGADLDVGTEKHALYSFSGDRFEMVHADPSSYTGTRAEVDEMLRTRGLPKYHGIMVVIPA